jgi:hypothetical protein
MTISAFKAVGADAPVISLAAVRESKKKNLPHHRPFVIVLCAVFGLIAGVFGLMFLISSSLVEKLNVQQSASRITVTLLQQNPFSNQHVLFLIVFLASLAMAATAFAFTLRGLKHEGMTIGIMVAFFITGLIVAVALIRGVTLLFGIVAPDMNAEYKVSDTANNWIVQQLNVDTAKDYLFSGATDRTYIAHTADGGLVKFRVQQPQNAVIVTRVD